MSATNTRSTLDRVVTLPGEWLALASAAGGLACALACLVCAGAVRCRRRTREIVGKSVDIAQASPQPPPELPQLDGQAATGELDLFVLQDADGSRAQTTHDTVMWVAEGAVAPSGDIALHCTTSANNRCASLSPQSEAIGGDALVCWPHSRVLLAHHMTGGDQQWLQIELNSQGELTSGNDEPLTMTTTTSSTTNCCSSSSWRNNSNSNAFVLAASPDDIDKRNCVRFVGDCDDAVAHNNCELSSVPVINKRRF